MNFASCPRLASAVLFHVLSAFAHFPTKYSHFCFDTVKLRLRENHPSTTKRLNAKGFKGARCQKVSPCVTCFAPSLGSMFHPMSGCSQYDTFSITCGTLVLQTEVCVAFGKRRRADPARLLDGALGTSAARTGPDVRQTRALSGFQALRSSKNARTHTSTSEHQ